MINPVGQEIKQLALVARQAPGVLEWLQRWEKQEVSRLPIVAQNVAVAQGRCQVLQELVKVLRESPETAAKLRE